MEVMQNLWGLMLNFSIFGVLACGRLFPTYTIICKSQWKRQSPLFNCFLTSWSLSLYCVHAKCWWQGIANYYSTFHPLGKKTNVCMIHQQMAQTEKGIKQRLHAGNQNSKWPTEIVKNIHSSESGFKKVVVQECVF